MRQNAKPPMDSFLDMNINSDLELPHIELSSNHSASVEGCKGVIEYDGSIVRINCGHVIVKFCGDNLSIRALTTQRMSVSGTILSIEFCT